MILVPHSNKYLEKWVGFNARCLEYINNCREYTYNVLEGAVRSSKTVVNVFAFAMSVEESKDQLHAVMGYSAKAAVRNMFESDGLGLLYLPQWQGRLSTRAIGPGTYSLILHPAPGSGHPTKEILPLAGGEADSESSFRGASFGIVAITEANLLHPASITALNERTYAAQIRRFFIDFNPSAETNFLYSFIATKWLGLKEGVLPLKIGTPVPVGYVKRLASGKTYKVLQYMHCTFKDNLSLSADRIEQIVAANDPESPEYKRNILGLRASGAGKIYHIRKYNYIEGQIQRARYFKYVIVADPGTTISETAFVLVGLTNDTVPELHVLNEYSHVNKVEQILQQKTDTDYVYDFFEFIRECEQIMGTRAWKIIVDVAAVGFIREYTRNAKVNGVMYPLMPCTKSEIDQRIKVGQALLYTGRLRFHKIAAQRTISEYENVEYVEKKSLMGTYEREDNPKAGKHIGLIDATEYAIEAFTQDMYRATVGTSYKDFTPAHFASGIKSKGTYIQ